MGFFPVTWHTRAMATPIYVCSDFHIKSDILIQNQAFNQTEGWECLARAPVRHAKTVHPAIIRAKGSGPGVVIKLMSRPASAPQLMESVPIMAEAEPSWCPWSESAKAAELGPTKP
jgi:hypothetical protein